MEAGGDRSLGVCLGGCGPLSVSAVLRDGTFRVRISLKGSTDSAERTEDGSCDPLLTPHGLIADQPPAISAGGSFAPELDDSTDRVFLWDCLTGIELVHPRQSRRGVRERLPRASIAPRFGRSYRRPIQGRYSPFSTGWSPRTSGRLSLCGRSFARPGTSATPCLGFSAGLPGAMVGLSRH